MARELRPCPPLRLTLTALLVACAPDKDPLDSISGAQSAGPTGGSQSSGNSSNGSNSSDSSGGSGTGGETESGTGGVTEGATTGGGEHGACDQFLLCIAAVDPASLPQLEESYGPNSSCWQLTPEIAQMCMDACAEGLSGYGMLYPDEPACGGSGSTSTSGPITSTTEPWTTGTTEPWTTGTTEPWTTGSTSGSTSGGGFGNCGWSEANMYYACGGVGEDPGGVNPIACPPNLPPAGEMCDENGAINSIGCCAPNGDNYYCGADGIVIDACGP